MLGIRYDETSVKERKDVEKSGKNAVELLAV